jgi:broad specificity phosphatase PhoE
MLSSSSSSSNISLGKNPHAEEKLEWLRANGCLNVKLGSVTIQATRVDTTDASYTGTSMRPSCPHTKLVHFQRHGQGYHNLLYLVLKDAGQQIQDIYHEDPRINPFVRPEIVDAPLTDYGRHQCAAQQGLAATLDPQVILVSPLVRAIETAVITFQTHHQQNQIPFVAHEDAREELGLLRCNQRQPLSTSRRAYPFVDFGQMSEQDLLFDPLAREPALEQSKRIYNFLVHFLRHRPEQELAVVGHSAWLFQMCHAVLECQEESDHQLKAWFGTSEIRSMTLTFHDEGEDHDDNADK